jgi:DNA topoisomerase IA
MVSIIPIWWHHPIFQVKYCRINNIIETLKNRKMIEITRKKLISTPFGRDIIAKMPAALTEPGITAAWEDALTQISQGSYRADLFMQRIESFVVAQIDKLVQKRTTSSPA